MRKLTIALGIFMALSGTSSAWAQTAPSNTNTPKIDKRQENQQRRIDQGVASGALTPEEAAKLEKRDEKLQQAEDAAKADGKVTKAERKALKAKENRNSKVIAKKKHNDKNASE